jgi:hypothetical protein
MQGPNQHPIMQDDFDVYSALGSKNWCFENGASISLWILQKKQGVICVPIELEVTRGTCGWSWSQLEFPLAFKKPKVQGHTFRRSWPQVPL